MAIYYSTEYRWVFLYWLLNDNDLIVSYRVQAVFLYQPVKEEFMLEVRNVFSFVDGVDGMVFTRSCQNPL